MYVGCRKTVPVWAAQGGDNRRLPSDVSKGFYCKTGARQRRGAESDQQPGLRVGFVHKAAAHHDTEQETGMFFSGTAT